MRGVLARFVFFLVVLAPLAASADSPPRVMMSTTGIDDQGSITRFTLRFSEPMVALGGGGPAPIKMDCQVPGEGRWVDPATFVWEFAKPLPGGITCKAELRKELLSASGRQLPEASPFTIDSGGPYARAVLPGDDEIDEDQVFFVATNGPVDRASIATGAYCAVDGIGEKIAVDLLPPDTAARILPDMGNRWARGDFLEKGGMVRELPEAKADRDAMLAGIVALKCRRPLPPGRDVALVWGKTIRSPSGRPAGEERRFDYTVRKEFSARLSCGRVNAQSGCDPVEAIKVEFSAPVPRANAMAARIDVGGGRLLAPLDDGSHEPGLSTLKFKPAFPPSITARLVLPPDLRDQSGRPLTNARRFPLEFEIAAAPPLVKFAAPFGILEAKQGGVLPVTVRGVEPGLAQSVKQLGGGTARIDSDDKSIAEWVRKVAKAQEIDIRDVGRGKAKRQVNHTGDSSLLAGAPGATRMRLPLPGGGKQFEVVGIPLARPGFYVVELASPVLGQALLGRPVTRYVSAAALVTDMAVHFKWGRAGSLAWVTSLDSGAPVAGAAVRVINACSGDPLAAGTTDSSGRLAIANGLPAPSTSSRCDSAEQPLMVSARRGGDFSFTLTDWGDGIQPYDFGLDYGWSEADPVLHAVLDRTLMKAGETVHMKLVYRAPTPRGFRSGGSIDGTLILHHRGSDTSFEQPLSLGADGIGEAEWTAPKGSPMGDYDISVKSGDRTISTNQSVRVEEYRLPSMRASVAGPREPMVRARQVPLDLYVGYLSGGGAAKAAVKLRADYDTLSDRPDGWDGWDFGGEAVHEGVVALDDENEARSGAQLPAASTLPLTLDEHGALRTPFEVAPLTDSARLTLEMDYQDADGEILTASTRIPLYASAVRLGIKPDGWLQRAGSMHLKVVALDLKGQVLRGQAVEVALYTREIVSARRRLIGGFYAFDNSARTTRIAAHCAGTTDVHGLVECNLDPGVSGEVIAVATTRDSDGNEARAVSSVYLAGDDDWWFGGDNGDRMDIVPDAKAYHSGDVAHVQVRMPFRDATALVTVEREGILSSFVTNLSGKDPVVDVPLDGSYAPDVFISVMAVRGRIANWRLWLADFAREWHLPFFNTETPTALVDLAKPSYRIGLAQVKVGWEAHTLKVAVAPDRETYHVRDVAQIGVQVSGPDGRPPQDAEIAFAAVDEALLQLSPNDSWDLLDGMMGERPLSVLTSPAQMQVVGKRHYGRKALPVGGGGGGDLSALNRSDFRPLLLWKGRVKLDAEGKANVAVPLADSLSAYRLVAIATSGENLFGTGSATIRTVQDLTIYSGVPPLVRSGDYFGGVFTLRNATAKPMKVTAEVALEPAVARGGALTVTIPAGGAVPVTWHLNAPEGIDRLKWSVSARSADGRASDRVTIDQQIVPAVPVETWAASFLRLGGGDVQVPIAAPPGALPGRGEVEVALTASPAPSLLGVRAYMLAYPYGCFEQRLSKAIALDDRAAWAKQMEDLPTYLDGDGLIRYWPSDSATGSIALSAYALSASAEAGLAWPKVGKDKVLGALRSVVDGRLRQQGDAPADARLLRIAALAAL
ncbi:MAG: alpha-2-macroglobulin, partial [Alphaproteobacteria bacterium]|nr:alpha-2-macroglobulin [Alphaproteobacteria bacterium]